MKYLMLRALLVAAGSFLAVSCGNESIKNETANIPQVAQDATTKEALSQWQKLPNKGSEKPASLEKVLAVNKDFILVNDKDNALWRYKDEAWTKMTGAKGQPKNVHYICGVQDHNFVLRTHDNLFWEDINGSPKSSKFNGGSAWRYVNESWQALTGATNQPKTAKDIFCLANINDIAVIDHNSKSNLWRYQDNSWKRLTGAKAQPRDVMELYNFSTSNFIALRDGKQQLWIYRDNMWKKITGAKDQPKMVGDLQYNISNQDIIILRDQDSDFSWNYTNNSWQKVPDCQATNMTNCESQIKNGLLINKEKIFANQDGIWQNIIGGESQPVRYQYLSGLPTKNFIMLADNDYRLWVYTENLWQKLSGEKNQPNIIYEILDFSTRDFIMVKAASKYKNSNDANDNERKYSCQILFEDEATGYGNCDILLDNQLWAYKDKAWQQITGAKDQPSEVNEIYGRPNKNFMAVSDYDDKLWVYVKGSWHLAADDHGQPFIAYATTWYNVSPLVVVSLDQAGNLWILSQDKLQ